MQEKWGEKYRVSIQQSHTQAILTLDDVTQKQMLKKQWQKLF